MRAALVSVTLLLALPAWGGTLTVSRTAPAMFGTITEAVAAAVPGDTISIGPGLYDETVTIDKDLALLGDVRFGRVVLQPTGTGGVEVNSGARVSLTQLEIDGTYNSGTLLLGLGNAQIYGYSLGIYGQTGSDQAVQLWENSRLELYDSVLRDNESLDNGGQIWANESAVILDNVQVLRGRSARGGGAIYVTDGHVELYDTLLAQNESANNGGAIYADSTALIVRGTRLSRNLSEHGGAMQIRGGSTEMETSVFEENLSGSCGGAIHWIASGGSLNSVATEFNANVSGQGGAVYLEGTSPTAARFSDGRFAYNEADSLGGAIVSIGASAEFYRNHFCKNDALHGSGGAAYLWGSESDWRNNRVLGNRADSGGAIYSYSSTLKLVNNGFLGSEGRTKGAALSVHQGELGLVNNLFAWSATSAAVNTDSPGVSEIGWNAFAENTYGDVVGTISAADLDSSNLLGIYADLYSEWAGCTEDYRPRPGSPLVNAGDPSRLDLDGSRSDMGMFGGADGVEDLWLDGDGDGTLAVYDCDDAAPAFSASAVESPADGVDQNCDGFESCYTDADADGYGWDTSFQDSRFLACDRLGVADRGGDCDDSSAFVSPAAEERVADGVDQTCDGMDLCFLDADGDGVGSSETIASSDLDCTDMGEASADGDCDDSRADVFPGATERPADGADGDCDGYEACYLDSDRDGIGSLTTRNSTDFSCTSAGRSRLSTDCDDANAAISPASTEYPADGVDQDCDGLELCFSDHDLDGFGASDLLVESSVLTCDGAGEASVSGDCLDSDDQVNPAAAEVCDGLDNNCDGRTDDASAVDATVWAHDADRDGYGDPLTALAACEAPAGYVATAGDCSDSDANTYPGAPELCDERDNDCDASVDEDVADVLWYPDTDGDSYGDPAGTTVLSCSLQAGKAARAEDCDDTRSTVFPRAAELIADGQDQDCDGNDTCYRDTDLDGFGSAWTTVASGLACELAGAATSSNHADCDDEVASTYPGASDDECSDGVDNDCDGSGDSQDDSDGDGLPWQAEAPQGGSDCSIDSDNDSIWDSSEWGIDTDADGVFDIADIDDDGDAAWSRAELQFGIDPLNRDSDGDGLSDGQEWGEDLNGDGIYDLSDFPVDSDGDFIFDPLDPDDDSDGVDTFNEVLLGSLLNADVDGDGILNWLDEDSDGDLGTPWGGSDGVEGVGDEDGDGVPNFLDPDQVYPYDDTDGDGLPTWVERALGTDYTLTDTDADGLSDGAEVGTNWSEPIDTDEDGLIDALDEDDDGDGVPSALEDVDADLIPDDTDEDGILNPYDDDDDDDGVFTRDEDLNGNGNWWDDDANSNGLPSFLDPTEPNGGDDDDDGVLNEAEDLNGNGNPDDDDSDLDGTPNYLDDDDDGDGVDTLAEGGRDTDADGLLNYLDTDDDGDGFATLDEANRDTDSDGVPDSLDDDDDGDGVLSKDELGIDTDGDGLVDALDPDSDDDGVFDGAEPEGDSDQDGIPDRIDTQGDGAGSPLLPESKGFGCAAAPVGAWWLGLPLLAVLRRRKDQR